MTQFIVSGGVRPVYFNQTSINTYDYMVDGVYIKSNPTPTPSAPINFVVRDGMQVTSNLVVGSAYLGTTLVANNGALLQGPVGVGTAVVPATSNLLVYGNIAIANTTVQSGMIFSDNTIQYTSFPIAPIHAVQQASKGPFAAQGGMGNYYMQGSNVTITLNSSSRMFYMVSGYLTASNVAVNTGLSLYLAYGTGAVPTSNAVATGTQVGATIWYTIPVAATAAADIHQPFASQAVITGLTPGVSYWLDIAANAVNMSSNFAISSVNITAMEV